VEALEDRQLLSVAVQPPVISSRSIRSNGVVTALLISDTPAAKALLQDAALLTVTLNDSGVTRVLPRKPLRVKFADLNGDGIDDLKVQYRRSALKGLPAGTVNVSVTDGSNLETGSFVITGGAGHK
jgi:hypothetical protein